MNKKYPLVIGALLLTATTSFAVGTTFTDEASFASWYKDAVKYMQETGVVTGYADGSFKADQSVTRGELSLILQRYEDNIIEKKIDEYFHTKVSGTSTAIDQAMVDKKIEAYFTEHKDDYFDTKIGRIMENMEIFKDQNIDYKTAIIMAESRVRTLSEAPDLEKLELTKNDEVNLPEYYEAYFGPLEEDSPYTKVYLHFTGPIPEGDTGNRDDWYGPFFVNFPVNY